MTEGTDWTSFENSFKTEERFLSQTAAHRLTSIFDGIGDLKVYDGRRLVIDAGLERGFCTLYRARVFQSDDKLKAALARPDLRLGAPPERLAATGRMNVQGISVFYGASNQKVAIAELRPPVDNQIAVAQFEIIRKLRLLDLTVFENVGVTGSLGDFGLAGRKEDATFLRSFSDRISRPVMPDDEPFEYLATQAVVDFLTTNSSVLIDGIIFPSRQIVGDGFNVVIFHKSARVEPIDIPEGTQISASTGRWEEGGWVDDFEVLEELPPSYKEGEPSEQGNRRFDFVAIAEALFNGPRDADPREASLRIVPESVEVYRVKAVNVKTHRFTVKRGRRKTNIIDIQAGR